MPSVSKAQQRFMGAELAQKKQGLPTKTDMSTSQMRDFASTSTKSLPLYKAPKKRGRKRGSFNYSSKNSRSPGAKMRGYKVT